MILVDSSVWIDHLRDTDTRQTERLRTLLRQQGLAIGDLVMAELLQGCTSDWRFAQTLKALSELTLVEIGGRQVAIEAARNFRRLRDRGIAVRKTIDCLIATRCIMDGHSLLYSDRDFDPFVEHLGLVSAMG